MSAWNKGEGQDDDLPVPLRNCQCASCIIGVAGDELARLDRRPVLRVRVGDGRDG